MDTTNLESQIKQLEAEIELFRRAVTQIREATEAIARTLPTPKQIGFLAAHNYPTDQIAVITRQGATEAIGRIKSPAVAPAVKNYTIDELLG